MRSLFGLAAAATLLVACASGGQGPAPAAAGRSDLPFEELPPQRLASGQCALVLWSKTTPARRIVMALNQPAVLRLHMGGRTLELPRTGSEGEPAFGHTPIQRYEGDSAVITLSVEMQARSGLVGGALVPSGTIERRDHSGQSLVVPVGGLVACEP